jgi:FtsH-binding integral membrane protein
MNTNINPFQSNDGVLDAQSLSTPKAFVANVFSYMSLALVISGVLAWWFGTTDLVYYLVGETGPTVLGWVTMFAPLGFILAMNFGFNRMSLPVLIAVFLTFAAVMGISLSYIFLIYSMGVIAKVFFITAALFATMAVVGYTTKTDLTKLGSILMMALVGLIIASLVNYFMQSERMDYIISCVGVLIFTGLIAYDTQKIKRIGAGVEYGTATAGKLAIMGATSLYLDFINLFLFLLRIFGRRD